jgi:hypothetical protein
MNCETCNAKIPTLHTRLMRVNSELWELSRDYYTTLAYPLGAIERILSKHGFAISDSPDVAICAGVDGRRHTEVGDGKWLSLTWHRMESGRYEVVAYVN